MARHDYDHDDDRGQYSRWRDEEDERQQRGAGGGWGFGEHREPASGQMSPGLGQGRERDHNQESQRRYEWRGESRPSSDSERDRSRGTTGERGGGQGWDWETNYGRTVDWNPRQGHEPQFGRESRSNPDDWRGQGRRQPSEFRGRGEGSYAYGPFVGHGPRGYLRSDDRIREDVCEVLTRHGQVDASDIEVDVRHGEVTLRGTVDSRRTKRLIEDLIDDVPGVHDVHNQVRAQSSSMSRSSQSYTVAGMSYQALDRSPRREEGEDRSRRSGRFSSMMGNDYRGQVREGMDVVGSDGESIGEVKDVSNNSFSVDRSMRRDVYIPFNAIQSVSANRITLSIRASEVDDQGWASSELMGSNSGDTRSR